MSTVSHFAISNSSENDIKIALEPWCHEYRLQPNQKAKIIGEGILDHEAIEINYSTGYIQVYGWKDNMTLLIDGKKPQQDYNN